MYKDQDKQREANRKAKRAQRARDNEPQGMTLADNVIPERTAKGHVRVSKPGDADYEGVGETNYGV